MFNKKSDIFDIFKNIVSVLKNRTDEFSRVFEFDSAIHDDYLGTLLGKENLLTYIEIPYKSDSLKNLDSSILAKLYIDIKAEIDKKSFNELSAVIKSKKGDVDAYVIERTILVCYNDFSDIIIKNVSQRKHIYFIDSDDIESIKTSIYSALKKFNPIISPHDMNALVNKVAENRLMTLVKARIRKNTIDKNGMAESKDRMEKNVSDEESVIEDFINREIKLILKNDDKRIITELMKLYSSDDDRYSEFKSTLRALSKITFDCRAIFIMIMRYSIENIVYSTKRLMEDLGIEKSEEAMRQSLRMCRKRLVQNMEI